MRKYYRILLVLIMLIVMGLPIFAKPVLADEASFYSSTSDGYLDYTDATYNTAWVAASAERLFDNNYLNVGQYYLATPSYTVQRGYLYFDTSGLPDDAVISTATLNLYVYTKNYVDTDFDVVIQDGTPTYPHDPLEVGDYDKSNYSDDGGSTNTSAMSAGAYNEIELNATGRGWISVSGTTKFCLRSSRDIAGTTPTGQERIIFYTADYTGTDYDPELLITYTTGTTVVETDNATSIQSSSVTLNGELLSLEGEDYGFCFFEYGTSTSYGSTTSGQNVDDTITFDEEVSGLFYSTTYHFRACVTLGGSTFYGEDFEFTTLPAAGANDDIIIKSVGVFTDYLDDDDWLVCVEVLNYYTNYYPDKNASTWFTIQLLDTDETTVLAASPLSNWGHRPSSIYINATQAGDLTYKEDYFVRCVGLNIAGTPTSDNFALEDSDWYGFDMDSLDSWCINTAIKMQISDSVSNYVTVLTDRGLVITDYAGGYFTQGIPGISQVRPNLFTTSQLSPDPLPTTDDSDWDSADAWATNVGTNIATDAGVIATPFGITGKDALSTMIILGAFGIAILVVVPGGGGVLGGLLISFPIVWLGTYFRIVPVAIITIVAIVFGGLAIRQFVVKSL